MNAPAPHLPQSPPSPVRYPFRQFVGALTLGVGLLVLVGWGAGSQGLAALGLNAAPMVANVALAFILSGTALLLLNSPRPALRWAAQTSAIVIGLLTTATLVETASDWNLGIDELLVLDPYHQLPAVPGRMAPNTAVGFLLTAMALWLMSRSGTLGRRRPWIIGGLGLALALLGSAALLGYLTGFPEFYDWGQFRAMPIPVALLFTLLGVTLLGFCLDKSGVHWRLGYWLSVGFALGLSLVIATAVYARTTTDQFAEANARVQRTLTVDAKLRQLEAAIATKSISLQGYLLTNNVMLRDRTTQSLAVIESLLTELREMTPSDTELQTKLDRTAQLISERSEFINQLIAERQSGDSAALAGPTPLASTTILSDKIRLQLDDIVAYMNGLRATQQASAERLRVHTAAILPIELLLIILLMVVALLRLNAEAAAHGRYLEILRRSEELKTSILNSMPSEIALLSPTGAIVAVNEPWLRFARERGAPAENLIGVGANYLDVCREAVTRKSPYAAEALKGIQAVLTGTHTEFTMEYPCSSPTQAAWYLLHATAIRSEEGGGALIAHMDITTRKQTEEALRKSEAMYRRLLLNLEAGVIVHASDTSIVISNTRACEILGLSTDQMQGKTAIDPAWRFINEDTTPLALSDYPVNRVLTGKKPIRNQILGIHRPGETTPAWVLVNGFPELDNTGKVTEVLISFIDITARKKAEDALRESELQMRLALSGGDLGIWDWDAVTGNLSVSERWFTMLGLDPHGPRPTLDFWHSLVHPEDLHRLDEITQKIIIPNVGGGFESEVRARHQNGNYIWILDKGAVVERTPDGMPLRVIGTHLDITKRKEAEAKIHQLNAELEQRVLLRTRELQSANQSLADLKAALDEHCIVSITDKHGTITYANDLFCAISKYTRAELLGQNHRIINSKFHPKAFFTTLWDTIRSGRVWHGEIRNQAKDGTLYWVNSTLVPFFGEDGKPFQFISIRNDITALKAAEANILKLNADLTKRAETLEAVNKELEAFSYSVSHDLRGPLRSIDGYSRMAIEDYSALLDDNGRRVLNVIRSEAQRMSRLIDDLLAFSRVSRQQAAPTTIDMQAMAQAVYTELITSEPTRSVEFKLQPLPIAKGTPEMIRQVWINLLSNALKFTRNRPVAVIEIGATTAADGSCVYHVKDNGAGFDMRYIGKLFGVFQRLHNQPDFEGTGVGLALVQRILKRHGGTIWAEAEVDHGACFSFTLPEPASATVNVTRNLSY